MFFIDLIGFIPKNYFYIIINMFGTIYLSERDFDFIQGWITRYMHRSKEEGRGVQITSENPSIFTVVNSHKKNNESAHELSEYQRCLSYIVQISVQQICTCVYFGKTGLFRCQSRQGHNKAVECASVLIPRCVFITLWGRHIMMWVPHSHLFFSIIFSECLDFGFLYFWEGIKELSS